MAICLLALAILVLVDDEPGDDQAGVAPSATAPVPGPEQARNADSIDSRTETPSVSDSTPVAGLMLQVVDPAGNPIGGARVHLRVAGVTRIVGRTSADGSISLPQAEGCREYAASHEQFAPSAIAVDCGISRPLRPSGTPPKSLFLVLSPAKSIEGRVVIGGSNGPSGIRVAALPVPLAPRAYSHPWDELLRDAEVILTETDALGRFVLSADPNGRYSLLAGGEGLVQVNAVQVVAPGESGLVIELRKAFSLFARFVEADGAAIRLASSARIGTPSFSVRPSNKAVELSPSAPLAGFFAGIPLNARWDEFREQDRICFQFVCDSAEDFAGPIDVEGWLPGYAPFTARLWARAIESGLVEERIVLQRTAKGFGSIRVLLSGERGLLPESHGNSAPALFLHLVDSSQETIAYRLMAWHGNMCIIRDIPTGQYSWSFVTIPGADMPAGRGQRDLQSTCVQENVETQIVVDVSDRGGLALGIVRQDGRPYVGALTGTLSSPPESMRDDRTGETLIVTRRVEFFRFSSPPYELSYLPPGEVSVRLTFPETTQLQTARISAGNREQVLVPLASR